MRSDERYRFHSRHRASPTRMAGGVVQQQDRAVSKLPACDLGDARRFDLLPVETPSRPVDGPHAKLRARLLRGLRALPIRRAKPAASHPRQLSDGLEAALEVLAATLGSYAVVAQVKVAVQTELKPAADDLHGEVR